MDVDVVIYYNPACGTLRNVFGLIRGAGIEPPVVAYLKTRPSREMPARPAPRMNAPARTLLREKGTPFQDLDLGRPDLIREEAPDAVEANPILLNRPIVVTPRGVRLCRPSETVPEILPAAEGADRGAAPGAGAIG